MGLIKNLKPLTNIVEKSLDIADQAITDKDKLNEMRHALETLRTQLMMEGKGSSVTKITICGVIGLACLVGTYMFLTDPLSMSSFKEYAMAMLWLIGPLVGVYGAATTIQKTTGNS